VTERAVSQGIASLALCALVAICGGACSSTPSPAVAAAGSPAKAGAAPRGEGESGGGGAGSSTAPVRSEGATSELAVADGGDCPAICAKLLRCKHGPWDNEQDCRNACEAAVEDDTASQTYHCAAKATSCSKLQLCGK
jgi:hypothetical protein